MRGSVCTSSTAQPSIRSTSRAREASCASSARCASSSRAFRAAIRAGAREFGRDPDEVVVLPGLSTVIGSTEAEARARRELLDEVLPVSRADEEHADELVKERANGRTS